MNYSVHITSTAAQDMANASDYIEFALKNPTAADSLLDEANRKISSLSQFPDKFALAHDSLLASWGIRFAQVNNYLAFYIIFEEKQQVVVVRFLYGKSNWASILKHDFSLI